ncbi:Glycosyltransferase involved in cell wall bisynthesis [Sphingomonas laterariae]|uniref:Glycosyltransferase involved in cell wall bisynthesis n=1 Tax=Edaphosphingomonas laterariae TaxID=861865 RepID=A0A239IP87_9SPHN|nr:glycosyltransferase family 4 protein [Sphingomonas laterariae]SNS94224.1 Glycosyltransferase involved in cell wall bisynthesis [Sphingomonas laterariae]
MIERIVILTDQSHPQGGASLLAVESALAFRRRGYAVTMVCGDDGDGPGAAVGVESVALGHRRLLDSPLTNSVRGLYNRATVRRTAEWIRANDTPRTIYHLHGWLQILSPSVFAALAPVRDRVLMTAHDFSLACPNISIYDYVADTPCPRTPMSGACLAARCDRRSHAHKIWRSARHMLQWRLIGAGQAPVQLLINGGMRPSLRAVGVNDDRMVTLANPVVPYTPDRIAAEANHNVLYVGRMETTKGIELAAEACRRAGVRLTAIGGGERLAPLKAGYPEMNFVGWLPHEDIAPYARASRMLVMPSLATEPFGLSAVEALWSGLPVIASKTSFLAGDIETAGAGLAVDPRAIDAFAAAIRAIADDPARTQAMSVAAYRDTRHLGLPFDRWIDGLLAAYSGLLAGGPGAVAAAVEAVTADTAPDAGPVLASVGAS